MSPQNELISLLKKQSSEKSEAIVVLQGDGFRRLERGTELYTKAHAPTLVLSGGLPETSYSIPADVMALQAAKLGVPKEALIMESRSQHTKEQANEVIRLAKERGWERLIIVASNGHEARAFLTFLKSMHDADMKLVLSIASPDDFELSSEEDAKISLYQKKGDVASYEEGIAYLKGLSE